MELGIWYGLILSLCEKCPKNIKYIYIYNVISKLKKNKAITF